MDVFEYATFDMVALTMVAVISLGEPLHERAVVRTVVVGPPLCDHDTATVAAEIVVERIELIESRATEEV